MKKILYMGIMLCCGAFGGSDVYGEELNKHQEDRVELLSGNTQKVDNANNEVEKKQITKEFKGRGDAEEEKIRQLREYRYSSLETSGLYAESGNELIVNVSQQDSLSLVIGTPERNKQQKVLLNQGRNSIKVAEGGAIYISNPNDEGSALVTITGATGSMPYFVLNSTSVEDFQTQMNTLGNATDVQLVSEKAIITVSYEQAKKNIENPKELMEFYDKFLLAQDHVSGISDEGNPLNYTDRHFQHFVEGTQNFMYATSEYMGFNGNSALTKLLKTNNGWGSWHESGHQRQQLPWKWNSVKESTVNIYSMAAQKEITGSITALDKYYPQMHNFFNTENKDFEAQNNDLKMVMFGQLSNTFGDEFYPMLHQYYRENKLSYHSNEEKIQKFMLNVSLITGYDMVPYFEQWGFKIDATTREATKELDFLPEQIWLNDNATNKKLPMKIINTVSLSESGVKVAMKDYITDMFQGKKLVLLKNNQVISELTAETPLYSSFADNIWTTDVKIERSDIINVKAKDLESEVQLYKSTSKLDGFLDVLRFFNSTKTMIQQMDLKYLTDARNEVMRVSDGVDNPRHLKLLDDIDEKFIKFLVKEIRIDETGSIFVEFSKDEFTKYDRISILVNDKISSEIVKGIASHGEIKDNVLSIPNQKNQENVTVQFHLPHRTYTAATVSKAEPLLKKQVQELFLTSNQINPDVTQEHLDDLRAQIRKISDFDYLFKAELQKKVNNAQQLFFNELVSELVVIDKKPVAVFSNELYKNYKVVLIENGKYIAEINKGKPYYGKLIGEKFNSSKVVASGGTLKIEVRHSSGTYTIKEIIAD